MNNGSLRIEEELSKKLWRLGKTFQRMNVQTGILNVHSQSLVDIYSENSGEETSWNQCLIYQTIAL